MKKAAMAGALGFGLLIALLLSMFLIIASDEDSGGSGSGLYISVNLSAEVLAHQPMVEKYAQQNGISDYVYVLLAIIQVESEGKLEDVMQSSESAGLPVNTLGTEDSIKQGCKYFSELVAKADKLGCDMDAIIQAYNYGSGFLDFVAKNGKRYTFELAQEFSRQHSGGVKVTYKNEISTPINGGWRYNYGNMFYVKLVKQYSDANTAVMCLERTRRTALSRWHEIQKSTVFRLLVDIVKRGRKKCTAKRGCPSTSIVVRAKIVRCIRWESPARIFRLVQ